MEQKDNAGALFRNTKKETEKQPDYTGKATVNGVEMFISAWINESKNGTKYMALKFEEPKTYGVPAAAAPPSDDLPF